MHRFVAMLWDAEKPHSTHLAQDWSEALTRSSSQWTTPVDEPGMRVLVMKPAIGKERAAPTTGVVGMVIGIAFERGNESSGPIASLSADLTRRAVSTAGDSLLEDIWGSYVAIWRDTAARQVTVLRDPSGAVPCLMTEAHGIRLLFSFADDVAELPGISLSVDWNQVQAFLYHNYFATKHTGLIEISELMPGERMVWASTGPPTFSWAWDPAAIAASPDRRDTKALRQDVRETVEACTIAWAKTYRSIVLQLSGGLDSSILLALLKRAGGASVIPLHTVNSGYEGYELELARLASDHVGAQLIERPLDPTASDLRTILEAPRLARPTRQILGIQANRMIASVCEQVDADAVMAGHGGDALFLQRGLAGNLTSDWIRTRGIGSGVLHTAYGQATLEQRSVWAVLGQAAGNLGNGRSWAPYAFLDASEPGAARVLAPFRDSALPASYFQHPWLEAATPLPPGKREQLLSFIGLYNYFVLYGYGVTLDAINPYQSQPIIELSLRIPTFQFVQGGRDRSLQRSAFADLIPERIARRTGKGFINHQLLVAVARNAGFLRELVLDGELSRQPWINRAAIEALFSEEQLVRGDGLMPALGLVSAEAWLRGWRRTSIQQAAVS